MRSENLRETQIALWLINSNITNPKIEDIINLSGKRDLLEAREYFLAEIKKRKLDFVFEKIEKPYKRLIKMVVAYLENVDEIP